MVKRYEINKHNNKWMQHSTNAADFFIYINKAADVLIKSKHVALL